MKHVYALVIKFIMIAIILGIVLGINAKVGLPEILYISAVVAIVTYIIGDLLILRLSNNITATISDIILSALTIYMFNYLWSASNVYFGTSVFAAILIAAGEWFFHKYVAKTIFQEENKS